MKVKSITDFVFICLLESRFSLLSIDWMIPDLEDPHQRKTTQGREEHHYSTKAHNPLNAGRTRA